MLLKLKDSLGNGCRFGAGVTYYDLLADCFFADNSGMLNVYFDHCY